MDEDEYKNEIKDNHINILQIKTWLKHIEENENKKIIEKMNDDEVYRICALIMDMLIQYNPIELQKVYDFAACRKCTYQILDVLEIAIADTLDKKILLTHFPNILK